MSVVIGNTSKQMGVGVRYVAIASIYRLLDIWPKKHMKFCDFVEMYAHALTLPEPEKEEMLSKILVSKFHFGLCKIYHKIW